MKPSGDETVNAMMTRTEINSRHKTMPFTHSRVGPAEISFFRKNGYLIVGNGISPGEVRQLRDETVLICRGERGMVPGLTEVASDEDDDAILRRVLCLHFPHKMSPVMLEFVKHPTIAHVLTRLIGPNVKAMQSMLFIKAAGKPGQAWHQDEDYIPTRDRSLTGAWIAMDDATIENGCLWVIPGSQRPGILWPQEWHGDRRFDCALESRRFPYKDEDAIPVEVKAGAIVFFNGHLLHRSLPNVKKSGFRRCLVNHYMSAESFLPWSRPAEHEAMAQCDYRDIVMIAGQDPYADRGIKDLARPSIRPSGQGGCESWGVKNPYVK